MTCAEKETRLASLRAAFDTALTGQITEVSTGTKTIRYGQTNINELRAAITKAQAEVDACNGVRPRGRAIRFMPTDD